MAKSSKFWNEISTGTNLFWQCNARRMTARASGLSSARTSRYGSVSAVFVRSSQASLKDDVGPSMARKTGDAVQRTWDATFNCAIPASVVSSRIMSP